MLTRRRLTIGAGAVLASAFAGPASAKLGWPQGARAAVSLTYDDGYDSQLQNVAPLLDALAFKATFFLTVQNIDARADDWVALSRKGHEIGNHTLTHPCMLKDYSAGRFVREQIAPAERYFDAHFGGAKPRSYAYPCGFEGLGRGANGARVHEYLEALSPTFLAARTVDGPPNDPRNVLRQRYFLNAYEPTYDIDNREMALRYVRKAVNDGHWAILVFHEVVDRRRGEGDTSVAVHREILEGLSHLPVWCAPVRTVFNYITGSV
ncbi:MAG: polysaccharide deacetylase family protein [Rhizomicrobium sp.]